VALAEEGSRRGEQGRGKERATHGGRPSRRWSGGSSTAVAGRCSATAAEEAGGRGVPEEEEEREGSEGLMCETKESRDLSVK
jgi:hypothetical protein